MVVGTISYFYFAIVLVLYYTAHLELVYHVSRKGVVTCMLETDTTQSL